MKNCGRRLSAAALAAALSATLSGCSLFGPGSYDLEIFSPSDVTSRVQSVYVIVTPKSVVQAPLGSASGYDDLLDQDYKNQYAFFRQFQPTQGQAGPSWKVFDEEGASHRAVTYEVDDETLAVSIGQDLAGASTEHCAIVLASYGHDGYKLVVVGQADLAEGIDQVLEVSTSGLLLSGS